jgi:GntR family transcriptional repressor for pyruvate dehydrogenase complex
VSQFNGRPSSANRPNLSNQLANGVMSLIRERGLGPGDRLPTARELAERFDVATPTMREALRKLQATGVIDIRHGSGIYVLRPEQRLVVANPGYGDLETHTILQILEARLLVEPHLAALAARFIEDAERVELESLLTRADTEVLLREYMSTNARFHTIIARASRNLVLAQIVESLIELYSTELDLVDPHLVLVEGRSDDNAVHHEIFAALAARDEGAAHESMYRHLQAAQISVSQRIARESAIGQPRDYAETSSTVT